MKRSGICLSAVGHVVIDVRLRNRFRRQTSSACHDLWFRLLMLRVTAAFGATRMADRKAGPGVIANQRPEGIFSPTLRPALGPSAAGSALRINLCEVQS